MARPDWYRRHYDEAYLKVYGPKLSPEGTALEAERIAALLGLRPGARLLDVACGQGRHSIGKRARIRIPPGEAPSGVSSIGEHGAALALGRARRYCGVI